MKIILLHKKCSIINKISFEYISNYRFNSSIIAWLEDPISIRFSFHDLFLSTYPNKIILFKYLLTTAEYWSGIMYKDLSLSKTKLILSIMFKLDGPTYYKISEI